MLTKPRYPPYSKYMKKYVSIVIAVFCMMLLSIFTACNPTDGETATQTTTSTITPGPQGISLINEVIVVNAKTNHVISFIVNANMKEVTVEGKFKTVDGRPNIEAYIMDDKTYINWLKGQNVSTILYDSGEKTIAFINQPITVPGKYHLIFTNWSDASLSPSQQVEAAVDLKWIYE